ncbi:rubredoxin [Rubidibacter lacunae KORDI 51-2]|uniref:Rubredoxin n=1 Tax=Rubidibacter lacunae KORDI 51-2 TaxID=582515 RepID=U5DLQ6_9CHRO|nr:rubredoxin [Rubidibacter lacunae]ERN40635.1 rubredoxin [Rubidibacter lacunae KORDI 51-2]
MNEPQPSPAESQNSQEELTLAELAPARFECRSCGYVYEPNKGDSNRNIPAGTSFEDLPFDWRCPVCGARQTKFSNIGAAGAPSGFASNLNYGLGVNQLTPGQKNALIFGGLVLAFLAFMSLYSLR